MLEQWKVFDLLQVVCPDCHSDNISNNEQSNDGKIPVTCFECGYQWYNVDGDKKWGKTK